MSTPRRPRLVALTAVLVLLLVIGGLLAVGGHAVQALLVLGLATLLNARMLALRTRLLRRTERGSERGPDSRPEQERPSGQAPAHPPSRPRTPQEPS